MSDVISPDGLAAVLAEHCKKYTDEIVKEVEDGIEQIASECKAEVKSLSPVAAFRGKRKGKRYRNGWTVTVKRTRGSYTCTVHNSAYQLVHLLELGHMIKDGTGRVRGEALPITHVATAEKHAEEKIERLIGGL